MTHAKRVAAAELSCKILTVWALAVSDYENSKIFLKQLLHKPRLSCYTNCEGSILHIRMGLEFQNRKW